LVRIQHGMVARNIIAVGASAGGFEAIQKVVSGLPADLHAAVFITQHLSERGEGILPEILNRIGLLPALHPWEETSIQMGTIYVAPPDYHLLLTPDSVHLGHGPKENLQRPCINTMFRSAASSHGNRVAGVLLTGLLDDGSAGLWEIQQHGGATVVQDPDEAAYRSMPENAIRGLNVQYIVRLAEMAPLLTRLTMGDKSEFKRPQPSHVSEEPITQACPECGGVMRLVKLGNLREYSCHVGHRFGLKTMISEKSRTIERAIWSALAQSEELTTLLEEAKPELDPNTAASLQKEIEERAREQGVLRKLIERGKTGAEPTGQA
jgi:two-component system, chemotaxis family, protein-glutamate methylesterase/glutaminase